VLLANLDSGGAKGVSLGDIFISPNQNITIQSPALSDFQNAGLIPPGESGLLLVEVVDNLASLLDNVDGNASPAALQQWANDVTNLAPGAILAGAQFVDISVVYTLYGGTVFDELDDLGGLSIDLTIAGLGNPSPGTAVELHSYPTAVGDDGASLTNEPGTQEWTKVPGVVQVGDTLNVGLTSLSVFAPLEILQVPPISLNSVNPTILTQGIQSVVTLTGIIPTAQALTAAEAAYLYTVTIGGQTAQFTDALKGGVAITASDYVNPNQATVLSPPGLGGGFADVTIFENANPSNSATLANAIQVTATYTVTTSVNGCPGTITLSPTNSPSLPAGTFVDGTVVSVQFAAANPLICGLANWTVNGNPVNGNPILVTVDQNLAITANTANISGFTLNINVNGDGTAQALTPPDNPDGITYNPGTVVNIVATPNSPSIFTGWSGNTANVADVNSANTTVTMNANTSLVANFALPCLSLTLNQPVLGGGIIEVIGATNPACGVDSYPLGTVITLRAVPNAGFQFVNWIGNVANPTALITTITLDVAQTVSAVFQEISGCEATGPSITGITPNNAWIFGGVVAQITGECLSNNTIILIGGQQVQGFRAAANGTSVDVVIPPTTDNSNNPTVAVDVRVSDGSFDAVLPGGFTYKRHQTGADGVNTTAFVVTDPAGETEVDVTLGGSHTSFAEIILPALDVPEGVDRVFGIARNALNEGAKGNTGAIASLGTSGIDVGAAIANTLDFTLNLYTTTEIKQNTPPVGSAVLPQVNGLLGFNGPIDANGNPVDSTPIRLSAPLIGSGITNDDVRRSLTLWGTAVDYDYVSETATPSDPAIVAYQSEIYNGEVNPAITSASVGSAQPDALNEARLYSLNGFSLRKNALLPEEEAAGIRLNTVNGTANGDVAGGTQVTIISPFGNLSRIDRIEVVEVERAKVVGGVITPANFVTAPGTDEFRLTVTMPPSRDAGIASFVIYGEAAPSTPLVTLDRVFEYTRQPVDVTPIFLLILGLLLALLGLAAGGDSGGGGGGPCFIATAAYGTPLAAQIDTLRDVRDTFLLDNAIGTALVDAYYHASPMIADAVAASPALAAVVRVLLVPVVFLGKVALNAPALAGFLALAIGALYLLRTRKAAKQ
jgi:hypothetical protein